MRLLRNLLRALPVVVPFLLDPAIAAEPAECRSVRLASPGWSDIDATNALVVVTLQALGYQPKVQTLSVPLIYQGLRIRQLDAFLGNWMPAQQPLVEPLLASKAIELLGTNLPQARFTLAVPDYTAAQGVRSFDDLAKNADAFSRKLYGIEAGAPANQILQRMIASNAHGLAGWQLVESSDTALQAQIARELRSRKPMVFLAWEPHLLHTRYKVHYLSGGEAYFGPDAGAAMVRTVARPGWRAQCPNVARLFAQIRFTVPLENEMLRLSNEERLPMSTAAKRLLQGQAELLKSWLVGVRTADDGDALAAAEAALR